MRADLGQRNSAAFTLIELLVTVAIIAMLLSLLLPAIRHTRIGARIVTAHVELRGIELALQMYSDNNAAQLPPSRFSCSLRSADELPIELARERLLPQHKKLVEDELAGGEFFVDAIEMRDVFSPDATYKYRAVGAAIYNESVVLEPPNGARLWVPADFPDCSGDAGRYHGDPRDSPVRYAIWSVGPAPDSPKFADLPGHLPIPERYWCRGAHDTGVITHFQGRDGKMYMSD